MDYLQEIKTYSTDGAYKDIIKKQYLKYRKDTLINAIFRCFVFEPDKDLKKFGKRRKSLGNFYEFNDLDLMKKTTFKFLSMNVDSIGFINTQLKPKSRSEFFIAKYAVNKEIDNLTKQLRNFLHRNYGLRLYQIPEYYIDGVAVKKFCLVPTDAKALDLLEHHPNYSKELLFELEHRAKVVESVIGSRKDKLATFQKAMQEVLKKLKDVKKKEKWS